MIDLTRCRLRLITLGIVLSAIVRPAIAAPATKWETCYFEASGGVGTSIALIVIEPFEIVAERKAGLIDPIAAFEENPGVASVVPGYTRFSSATYGCDDDDTREGAQSRAERVKGWGSYAIKQSVQWAPPASVTGLGGAGKKSTRVSSVKKGSASGAGPGATVVKADTGAKDAADAWNAQVRNALAAEAQKKVETAAKAAQADAQRQAEIQKFFAERRRKGRAQ